jgi:nucleoside 2-deoxyribosyltransferase
MMRLGGVMHAARALWAMGVPFGLGYVAPAYLREDIEDLAGLYGAAFVQCIGTITGCPNVMLVGEGLEVGPQRYEYLLRDQSECDFSTGALRELGSGAEFTDYLAFPGGFPLADTLKEIGARTADVHADVNFVPAQQLQDLSALKRRFASVMLSTSSGLFLDFFGRDPTKLQLKLSGYADSILLKENRGGSRLFYTQAASEAISTPAQTTPIMHSVGVGDVFDAVFVVQRRSHGDTAALAYASFAAAEYASCFRDSDVQQSIAAALSIDAHTIGALGGVVLPWEGRETVNIYLAAPDFDYVDTAPLDALAEALAYHNFTPRRPVREHGQVGADTPASERRRIAEADLDLLAECALLIAVLLHDDPGTLIEIGVAIEKHIPVIVYDPFKRASNIMLTELPVLVSSDLDQIVSEVFVQAAKLKNGRA